MLFALIVALWTSGDPTDEWGLALGWGENFYGQCNTLPNLRHKIKSVHVGERHTVALLFDGTLRAWGDNTFGQCQVPAGYFEKVSVGQFHSAAIRPNGELVLWGSNFEGETNSQGEKRFHDVNCLSTGPVTFGVSAAGEITTWGGVECDPKILQGFQSIRRIAVNDLVNFRIFYGQDEAGSTFSLFILNGASSCFQSESQLVAESGMLVAADRCPIVLDGNSIIWGSCNVPPFEGELIVGLFGRSGSVLRTTSGIYSSTEYDEDLSDSFVGGDLGTFHSYILNEPDCNTNGIEDAIDLELGTSTDFNANGIVDECDRDCDEDGIPDFVQIEQSFVSDCDQSGVLDVCEIAIGLRDDDNQNGLPDQCELDCNLNGVPDYLDVFSGSSDTDSDGVPDECNEDCNENGLWDVPEIEQGLVFDCDFNQVPDDCQIDSDGDTIIDACDSDDDGDGIDDSCDIDITGGADCDGNGVDDSCQKGEDLDGDGIGDDCDVEVCGEVFGADCQSDGILDDCQLPKNDCNTNGVPDDCEDDCDGDGFPDGCEQDSNTDGVPDDCQCLADVVPNQQVDFADLITMTSNWGDCPEGCPFDLNSDGSVGLYEILKVLSDWGPC